MMFDRFWLWLYHLARGHLPEGYRDEVWRTYLASKMDELRQRAVPEEFMLFIAEDLELDILEEERNREIRMETREIRDQR